MTVSKMKKIQVFPSRAKFNPINVRSIPIFEREDVSTNEGTPLTNF